MMLPIIEIKAALEDVGASAKALSQTTLYTLI
jgi:hypothetical protein